VTTVVPRPRLRSDVVLGPGLRCGPRTVHRVKDRRTGCVYRVGPREHFVMRLMDGEHTMEDIATAYAGEFGKVLGPDSRRQIFGMLGRFQLLDGHTDDDALERLRVARQAREETRDEHWYSRRRVLARPDRLCAALARALGLLFRPAAVAAGLLLAVAAQVLVWTRHAQLLQDAAHHAPWPVAVPVTLLLVWALIAVHEVAHGVACRYYGGEVTEIGVRLRLPLLLVPYCRTDDVMLFTQRTARVGTAFAGCYAVLLLMAPVSLCWALAAPGGAVRATAAVLLLVGSGGSLAGLLPFLGLDGQAMLEHALGRTELGRQTWRLARSRPRPDGYRRADLVTHTAYGLAALAGFATVYVLLLRLWYDSLRDWTGPTAAVVVLAAEHAVLLVLAALLVRHRTRTTRKGPDER
jgi:putative peptide zinc metalloprotease protein